MARRARRVVCGSCGQTFAAGSTMTRYCGEECRRQAAGRRRREARISDARRAS